MSRAIELWTSSKALLQHVDEALSPLAPRRPTFGREAGVARGFRHVKPTSPKDRPPRATYVVTTGSSRTAERYALTYGATPLVLPEAGEYLLRKAEAATPAEPLVLLGFDLRPGK